MKDFKVQLWNFAPIFRQKTMKNIVWMIFFAWNDFAWINWEETNQEIAGPTPIFFHLVDATLTYGEVRKGVLYQSSFIAVSLTIVIHFVRSF